MRGRADTAKRGGLRVHSWLIGEFTRCQGEPDRPEIGPLGQNRAIAGRFSGISRAAGRSIGRQLCEICPPAGPGSAPDRRGVFPGVWVPETPSRRSGAIWGGAGPARRPPRGPHPLAVGDGPAPRALVMCRIFADFDFGVFGMAGNSLRKTTN